MSQLQQEREERASEAIDNLKPNALYMFQKTALQKISPIPSGLIGDDMGTGKTVEAIAIDWAKRKAFAKDHNGKAMTLVVCPLGVRSSWQKHYKRWRPDLKTFVIDPKNREAFVAAALDGKADVFICHWDSLRLMPELQKIWWFHIIADEVHRAKSRDAQQTVALKKLSAANKLGLSGTPADNKPDDLWSILNWLYPKIFTSYWSFRKKHVRSKMHGPHIDCCEKQHKSQFTEIMGPANVDELHRKIERFYIRRLKEEVLTELPEKYYSTIMVDLDPKQRKAYNDMLKKMLAWVGENEDQPIAAPILLSKLTRLQQFACAFGRILEAEKIVKCKDYPELCPEEYHPRMVRSLVLEDPSSKLDAAMELIKDNPNTQLGFFSHSKQLINLFAKRLDKAGITKAIYTGDTDPKEKDRVKDAFQAGDLQIFAGTIRAGGEGIELTAASTCVFLSRDWNPSKNRQAEDRFHRIGQRNAVHIIDIMSNNTVEPDRNTQIQLKWEWLKELLGDTKKGF